MDPTEHHLSVQRTARYYTLGTLSPRVRDIWFVCHGYGQLAGRFIQQFAPIVSDARFVVAPEALLRYYTNHAAREVGGTWMTSEDRLTDIADYVAYLDSLADHVLEELDRGAVRLWAVGFSQGGATVSRWAALGRTQPDHVVLWGSPVPPDLDLATLGRRVNATGLTLVMGTRDDFVTSGVLEREVSRLRTAQLSVRVRRFEGGHRIDHATLLGLADGMASD